MKLLIHDLERRCMSPIPVCLCYNIRDERKVALKRFYRSSDEKIVGGVCAGLARYFDLNLTGLRWVVSLVTLFLSGIPLILYVMAWAVFKEQPTFGIYDV